MKALLLVDFQNDFMPTGALGVEESDTLIPKVDALVKMPFPLIVATKDWHPVNHSSFASNHRYRRPGDHIQISGVDQVLWPAHCVQGSRGSEFASGWDTSCVDHIIFKGTDPLIDSYSSFYDNAYEKETGLESYLKERKVKELYIAGLATDYCVKYSVLDAIELGFEVSVIVDVCKGVNLQPQDSDEALALMEQEGASLTCFKEVSDMMLLD